VSRMSSQARQEFYLGRVAPTEERLAKVDAVTSDEVDEEAERLFDSRVLSLSVVGNVGKLPLTAPDLAAAL
jgi:predicted Zn-dependent peptidase